MLGRQVTFRFAAGASPRPTRLLTTLPLRCLSQDLAKALVSHNAGILVFRRFYATPQKPKKGSIGESSSRSRTRKPRDPTIPTETDTASAEQKKADKALTKEKAAKKKAAEKEKKVQAAKARVAKRAATAKAREKKKKEAVKVREARKKKKEAATKAREVRQKEKEAAMRTGTGRKSKAMNVKQLQEAALQPPSLGYRGNAWAVYLAEKNKASDSKAGVGSDERKRIVKEIAADYRNLSPAEIEHYNHIANEDSVQHQRVFDEWTQSHTPSEIRSANHARGKLRALFPESKRKYYNLKYDKRMPNRANAYIIFAKERQTSGDMKHIDFKERTRLVAEEWKALSQSEKQRYISQQDEHFEAYAKKHRELYGRDPPTRQQRSTAA